MTAAARFSYSRQNPCTVRAGPETEYRQALMATDKSLKSDSFGEVILRISSERAQPTVVRDTRSAAPWLRLIARRLASREARALHHLRGVTQVPQLISSQHGIVERSWLPGEPMHLANPTQRGYFRQALRLLRLMHRRGVVHNDTAKEPNWLMLPDGRPALVDFQLAGIFRHRGRLFRLLAREDIRHLLKHKRTYCAADLSARQWRILDDPAWISRLWMATGKPVYRWITRGLLGWVDRDSPADRVRTPTQAKD